MGRTTEAAMKKAVMRSRFLAMSDYSADLYTHLAVLMPALRKQIALSKQLRIENHELRDRVAELKRHKEVLLDYVIKTAVER